MELTKNDIMIEDILHLLKECLESDTISKPSMLKKRLHHICATLETNPMYFYKHKEEFVHMAQAIKSCIEKIEDSVDEDQQNLYLSRIRYYVFNLFRLCLNNSNQPLDYNTESYYTQQIKELQEKERTLNKELLDLKRNQTDHKETENELNLIKEKIKEYELEKDDLKKKLDARENIKERISTAFDELKKHISHLKMEKKRLNWMFGIYAFLCIAVLAVLIYFEFSYLSKWEDANRWIDYLPFYIPVPIVGGLLWVFISQMNRAQRQLMQVANALYHIDYVEGLLLAINHISSDVNSASEKICNVLDGLIRNHMAISDGLSEQSLDAEIAKDNIKLHTFINLAKEVKEVIK